MPRKVHRSSVEELMRSGCLGRLTCNLVVAVVALGVVSGCSSSDDDKEGPDGTSGILK
jgi:hypothetical protein